MQDERKQLRSLGLLPRLSVAMVDSSATLPNSADSRRHGCPRQEILQFRARIKLTLGGGHNGCGLRRMLPSSFSRKQVKAIWVARKHNPSSIVRLDERGLWHRDRLSDDVKRIVDKFEAGDAPVVSADCRACRLDLDEGRRRGLA